MVLVGTAALPAAAGLQERTPLSVAAKSSSTDERIAIALERAAPTADDAKREAADLHAQQDMAEWARWMVFLTLAQALVAIVSIGLVLRSLSQSSRAIREATHANQIAQSNHVSDVRPWLEIEDVKVAGWGFTSGGLRFDLEIRLKNVGASPARNIWVDLIVEPETRTYPSAQARSFRERVRTDPIYGERVVFPGATRQISESVTLFRSKMEVLPNTIGTLRNLKILIIGVARYESVFNDDPPKQSGFSYRSECPRDEGLVLDLDNNRLATTTINLQATERGWYAD
ncbi:MAG: hypothetical protein KKB47_02125 [Alphaproteobacteria bacterium]|nr:hypothetical protein [Alphaproteobacteria bacterium]MBU2361630.1 hypothetical protein [Alphaproteobacteria bacterium]